jgi:hypothetical protein
MIDGLMLDQHVRWPFWQRHPWVTGAAAIVVFWQLMNGWYATVATMALIGLMVYIGRRGRAAARRDAGLRARADYEYRLSLAGDPRGMFGRYPPVQAGWFPDPRTPWQLRYFDGAVWTGHAIRR